ncbi:MAG: alpha/beta fold hydrolase [Pseudomonadota bacterium]
MSVHQKAVVGIALLLGVLGAGFIVTALFISWHLAALLWLGVFTVFLACATFFPVRTGNLAAVPRPCASFGESLARFQAETEETAGRLNPLCYPQLLHHEAKADIAVVLIHGISSCPRAFVDFAPLLHGRGHNVLSVRMPCNGLKDRSTDALNDLTAAKLAVFGDKAVDLAQGLGDRVVVLGISAGGTVAAWLAQTRRDVDHAILVAPFLGLPGIGLRLNLFLMRIMLVLPATSVWKDPVLRERYTGMPHAYKRQSTRGTGEVLRLGYATALRARDSAPAAEVITTVLNDNDQAIDNRVADHLADLWETRGKSVTRYRFPKEAGLGHEIIDPMEPGADPSLTYPVLAGFVEERV